MTREEAKGYPKWNKLSETEDMLKDHYYYLVAVPMYKTPMKAKYHIDERLQLLGTGAWGDETMNILQYEFNKMPIYWMELPEMPEELAESEE